MYTDERLHLELPTPAPRSSLPVRIGLHVVVFVATFVVDALSAAALSAWSWLNNDPVPPAAVAYPLFYGILLAPQALLIRARLRAGRAGRGSARPAW